jgi:integrase
MYELPSGSFRVTVSAGTDPLTGRRRQLRETVGIYAEAEKALTRLQSQVDDDQHPKSEITVRRAIEQWL